MSIENLVENYINTKIKNNYSEFYDIHDENDNNNNIETTITENNNTETDSNININIDSGNSLKIQKNFIEKKNVCFIPPLIAKNPKEFDEISEVFFKATENYARHYDFDTMSMDLLLGLVFNESDVDDDNQVRENAKPYPNVVRYYTGSVKSYLDGKQTNEIDYDHFGNGRQSYIDYNLLLAAIEFNGLSFSGPATFEEFKERILAGDTFDITMSADLKQKEEKPVVKTK